MSSSLDQHSADKDFFPNLLACSPHVSGEDLKVAFEKQQEFVNHFFDHVDVKEVEAFCALLMACEGMVFFSGTGKSGIVARVISQMFQSIGLRAVFMNPTDALHGDVGMMRENDLLVMFSKSGQTAELIGLLPAARAKKAKIVAVVSNAEARLVTLADAHVILPLQEELCPFGLAPTTSTILQLIFGNTVLATIMQRIDFSRDQYALNHPAGRIGKRLTMRVDQVMIAREALVLCSPHKRLLDAIPAMSSSRCGCLLLEDEHGSLHGIFTDGDLRRAIERGGADALQRPLSAFSTRRPRTTAPSRMAFDAMKSMQAENQRVKELPVVDTDNRVLGLLTIHDLVQAGL